MFAQLNSKHPINPIFRLTSGLPKIYFLLCYKFKTYFFWKSLRLYFNNLQKIENLQKFKYLLQSLVIWQKVAKLKITRNATNYTLLKISLKICAICYRAKKVEILRLVK